MQSDSPLYLLDMFGKGVNFVYIFCLVCGNSLKFPLHKVVGRLMVFTFIIYGWLSTCRARFGCGVEGPSRSLSRKVNALFDKVFFGLCILIIS